MGPLGELICTGQSGVMTLEQWLALVNKYGESAYLMVDFMLGTTCISPRDNHECFESVVDGGYENIKPFIKQAALPFDLVAARAGDEVEWFVRGNWYNALAYNFKSWNNLVEFVCLDGTDRKMIVEHLRMKHPRRVGVDYSQFGD